MFSSDKNDLIVLLQKLLGYVIYSTVLLAFGVLFNPDAFYLFGILTIIFYYLYAVCSVRSKKIRVDHNISDNAGIPLLALYLIDEKHKTESAMTASPTVIGVAMMLEMLILVLYFIYCIATC